MMGEPSQYGQTTTFNPNSVGVGSSTSFLPGTLRFAQRGKQVSQISPAFRSPLTLTP